MEIIPVVSSTIKAMGYDEETEHIKSRLTVIFNSGTRYTYYDVPRDLWKRFKEAESAGQFFVRHIKGIFDYQKSGRS